jgi:predicted aconitase
MQLAEHDEAMLAGDHGQAAQKSMRILRALGEIYGATSLVDVASVQVAGVSYDNLGQAGLDFLSEMAADGRARVLTTLNPAGMDVDGWQELGISADFAGMQRRVLDAFARMGVVTTCTCTPYLVGNLPRFGQHVAWSESSAVCFANSVIGARTNREGGPSALAAALTGRTPAYGLHLAENRRAQVAVEVKAALRGTLEFGALGVAIGAVVGNRIPYIQGCQGANLDQLKSLAASLATYGGTAMFQMAGVTPEGTEVPGQPVVVDRRAIDRAREELDDQGAEVDFISIGCPHASLDEVRAISKLLEGRRVVRETWIHVARPIKTSSDRMGYTGLIEAAGAKVACDTCMVVAPLKGRFSVLATNSAKAAFYGRAKNGFSVAFRTLEQCLPRWGRRWRRRPQTRRVAPCSGAPRRGSPGDGSRVASPRGGCCGPGRASPSSAGLIPRPVW